MAASGVFQGIDTNKVDKLTSTTVELPLTAGKYYAVEETNNALATCYVNDSYGTAAKVGTNFVKAATLTGATQQATDGVFRLAVMIAMMVSLLF